MEEDKLDELRALVVGFLQQSLSDNPQGFSLSSFEKVFPERADEPRDWYKRYQKKSPLEALESIKDAVKIYYNSRYNSTYISLNLQSDKVDNHLVDLITHQKQSSKKRRPHGRPNTTHRALASFSLNRQYSGYGHEKSRLNHANKYRGPDLIVKRTSPPTFKPSIYAQAHHAPSSKVAAGDPRIRSSLSSVPSPIVHSQVRSTSSVTVPKPRPTASSVSTPKPSSVSQISSQRSVPPSRPSVDSSSVPEKKEDTVLTQKKSYLRQRIVSLLTRKFPEIKILYLNSLYQLEYEETIDPSALGHPNLTSLLQDPALKAYIQINYKSPFFTISTKNRGTSNGKENVDNIECNKQTSISTSRATNGDGVAGKSKVISYSRAKLDAIDPFNVRTMIQSLEPLGPVKDPPTKNFEIDEMIKYKTLRIIIQSPDRTIRLDDWEKKFEVASRLKIRIRDYGCKTLLEFFKILVLDMPVQVLLGPNDDWIAVADISAMSNWIHDKMLKGHYRSITALDSRYELTAYPTDTYTYADAKDFSSQEYHPAYILSVKNYDSIWIQLRTPKRIEDHLCVEASMTCYKEYQENGFVAVPEYFVKPGFPCAVYDSSQKKWCRALILEAPVFVEKNESVTALLVDYGLTRKFPISKLACIMRSHLRLPVGPIYAGLAGVKEKSNAEDQQALQYWAKMILQEYTNPPVTLACKFGSTIPKHSPPYLPKSCVEITLIDTRHGKDFNLADDINLPRESREG